MSPVCIIKIYTATLVFPNMMIWGGIFGGFSVKCVLKCQNICGKTRNGVTQSNITVVFLKVLVVF